MTIQDELKEMRAMLEQVVKIHSALPTWYPINREYAKECGYATMDGLRKWCYNNLDPDKFEKRGKHWYIHVSALPNVKLKAG